MYTKTIKVTYDEAEDIRFALAQLANSNEALAGTCEGINRSLSKILTEQCERLRALAKKVSA